MKLRVRNFMNELGFRPAGETAFGILDGYLVSIADGNGLSSLFIDIALREGAEITREKIRNLVAENARQYAVLRAEIQNTGVLLLFDSSPSAFGKLKDFLFFFVQQLHVLKIPGASVCSNCGEAITAISIISINGRLHTCDRACAEELLSSARKKLPRRKEKSRFFAGAFGALSGALLGAIPYILISRSGLFSLWAGLLIGAFAKGGYEIFGGRPSAAKTAALPFFALLSSAASVFLSLVYTLSGVWSEQGYIVRFSGAAEYLLNALQSDAALQMSAGTETGVLFLFSLLGMLLLIRFKKHSGARRAYIVS